VKGLESRLQLYDAGKPYREPVIPAKKPQS